MRRVFLIAGLMTAFAVAVVASSAAANFAGTWTLDKTKSQGLSPRMAGADKVTWTITQDAATISIDSKVEGGQPPAGGGGGMGGGRPPAGPTVYKLDGSEVTSDVNFGGDRQANVEGNVGRRCSRVIAEDQLYRSRRHRACQHQHAKAFTVRRWQGLDCCRAQRRPRRPDRLDARLQQVVISATVS
ncbi:MAG TPA: hypothetical protein VK117_07935 [Pyrinomonadaceae bacterium]|nr:hypothetical protein [Pyrinomonadaceae bacterium]